MARSRVEFRCGVLKLIYIDKSWLQQEQTILPIPLAATTTKIQQPTPQNGKPPPIQSNPTEETQAVPQQAAKKLTTSEQIRNGTRLHG